MHDWVNECLDAKVLPTTLQPKDKVQHKRKDTFLFILWHFSLETYKARHEHQRMLVSTRHIWIPFILLELLAPKAAETFLCRLCSLSSLGNHKHWCRYINWSVAIEHYDHNCMQGVVETSKLVCDAVFGSSLGCCLMATKQFRKGPYTCVLRMFHSCLFLAEWVTK